jgi:hypothetical protein
VSDPGEARRNGGKPALFSASTARGPAAAGRRSRRGGRASARRATAAIDLGSALVGAERALRRTDRTKAERLAMRWHALRDPLAPIRAACVRRAEPAALGYRPRTR